ncbi:nuclease SbcCD subunit D [Geobacillus stearothermophilus]|uniref:exonuclease SbcCD subunit D n=1 Tax=Geobacillus TaxID=129337 RepID=UPI0005048E03|nr:exonuclease SbcCD subunit D [Geobacillus sp. FJAT-46040]ATA59041.1 DNA repair exonuclease [Geobacillus stearothermophilus]KFL14992.1 nuclease SbcCD subunit D [Geobacillus stearothermophilus]KFX34117.1 nuclease SbcCD subunit D [Geobacillus stearothermophilus]MED4301887.1 exonuclease SbcCD subunit D [Geobacillus stearothermophilus]WJQ00892.1 exonuclease SbcCD subunit D [Geobacillus stearothermophilus]
MRILHTADWHLGRTLEGRSRLAEQEAFIDELVEIVAKEQIDVVLMAGDVFDSVNPPAAAEQLFYESLARLSDKGRRPVAVISGNHDHPDRISAARPLLSDYNIFLFGRPQAEVCRIDVPSCGEAMMLAPLAYPSESRLAELLSSDHKETALRDRYDDRIRALFAAMAASFADETVNVVMSHLYVAGGHTSDSERPIEVGGAYTVAAASLPGAAQYVALGHLHRPQDVRRAETAARYAGSPLAYSFSEAGHTKSVTVVDVQPGGKANVTEIPLVSGKPLVRWKATDGLAQVYRWCEEGRDRSCWIDLEVHVNEPLTMEEIQRLRKLHQGFIHIRPVFPEREREAAAETDRKPLSLVEMFRRFYERQTGGQTPDEELVRLFLELAADEKEGEGEEE